SKFPRRGRIRIAPEPTMLFSGIRLGLPVTRLDVGASLVDIFLVYPRISVFDLLEVDINAVQHDDRQYAAVAISAVNVQLHVAAEYQLAQVLFGSLAGRL